MKKVVSNSLLVSPYLPTSLPNLSTYLLTYLPIYLHTDMSLFLGEPARSQVYMGGGAFRFFGINVYQVALYIEANRAAASPQLKPFAGK